MFAFFGWVLVGLVGIASAILAFGILMANLHMFHFIVSDKDREILRLLSEVKDDNWTSCGKNEIKHEGGEIIIGSKDGENYYIQLPNAYFMYNPWKNKVGSRLFDIHSATKANIKKQKEVQSIEDLRNSIGLVLASKNAKRMSEVSEKINIGSRG